MMQTYSSNGFSKVNQNMFQQRNISAGKLFKSKQSVIYCTSTPTNNRQLLQQNHTPKVPKSKDGKKQFVDVESVIQSQDFTEFPVPTDLATTTQAIILAGGSSNNPLATYRAIAATPLGCNLKVIDATIHNCLKSGIDKIYVLTQFNSQPLNSYISNSYLPTIFGRSRSWVEVLTSTQTPDNKAWARGSADAVKLCLPTLLDRWHGLQLPDEFLILSAEAVYSMDYGKLIAAHRQMEADITIATTLVDSDQAFNLGLCIVEPVSQRVIKFVEKPKESKLPRLRRQDSLSTDPRPYEASMGVYVFKRQVLADLLQQKFQDQEQQDFVHFGADVIPHALTSHRVCAYYHSGMWQNLTNLRDYYKVNMDLVDNTGPISIEEATTGLSMKGKMLPPSSAHGCSIDSCLIGEGCILEGSIFKNSVIGDNVIVGKNSLIENSMIWGAEFYHSMQMRNAAKKEGRMTFGIGSGCVIKNAIIDYNVSIGDNCVIANASGVEEGSREDVGIVICEGIVVVRKDAKIPDGFKI